MKGIKICCELNFESGYKIDSMVIFLTFDFENKYVEFMFVVVLTVSGVKIAIHCTVCVFKEKNIK